MHKTSVVAAVLIGKAPDSAGKLQRHCLFWGDRTRRAIRVMQVCDGGSS